ncbi:TetR family transcriptional regulator [Nocardioides sp. zg-536]|uniref:TetR family transcriptional regulator n=1 Tax=Nocardioides faecalis TaxID=2803858 RepID=A0A939BZZ6_9ACTN|nr:TetR family transcriptional regulator [Nocardioides faecalis]MBM9461590.1 TetR family transcriptional regulator [Nocardioides faecalis]MBS4752500.1 TetR family transcriptional regulator [Nocardioides faecalis]QVI57777.1 TetR family transcriptional regulator [Nocardioides faecalis]
MAEHEVASGQVAAAVRAHRTAQGTSLRALAGEVGVSPATLSAIETGKTPLTVQRLHLIAHALEVPVGRLLSGASPDPARGESAAGDGGWRTFAPLRLDAVLDAALRIFVARGFHAATMREIAAEMGVSVAAIYHHYASKQQILRALMDLTMSELTWRLEAARAEGGSEKERFALMVEALALFHAHRADLAFLGASEMRGLTGADLARVTALRDDVQHALDEQAARAFPEVSQSEVRTACRAVATMCTSLPSWFSVAGPVTAEQVAHRYARYAVGMLSGAEGVAGAPGESGEPGEPAGAADRGEEAR